MNCFGRGPSLPPHGSQLVPTHQPCFVDISKGEGVCHIGSGLNAWKSTCVNTNDMQGQMGGISVSSSSETGWNANMLLIQSPQADLCTRLERAALGYFSGVRQSRIITVLWVSTK